MTQVPPIIQTVFRTLHYSAPNSTDQERRAYILVFSGPGQRLENPAERPWIKEEQEALAKLKSLAADK